MSYHICGMVVFIYSFIYLFINSFILLFIYLFVYIFIYFFIYFLSIKMSCNHTDTFSQQIPIVSERWEGDYEGPYAVKRCNTT